MVGQRLIGVGELPVFKDIELVPPPAPRACSASVSQAEGWLQGDSRGEEGGGLKAADSMEEKQTVLCNDRHCLLHL